MQQQQFLGSVCKRERETERERKKEKERVREKKELFLSEERNKKKFWELPKGNKL